MTAGNNRASLRESEAAFMTAAEARVVYDLRTVDVDRPHILDETLAVNGIAKITMPLRDSDFEELARRFDDCIDDCPELLAGTYYLLDSRFGNEVGYRRKDLKINPITGLQTDDAKDFMHFTEGCTARWQDTVSDQPKSLRDFLDGGEEIRQSLQKVALLNMQLLEETHPNMTRAYFGTADRPHSRTFFRFLRYAGYEPHADMGDVAKGHHDIGGLTIQAFADAPGFWAAPGGFRDEPQHFDTSDGEAYLFAGASHRRLYGSEDRFKSLWHGVHRSIAQDATYVPERHAAILFIDPTYVDCGVTKDDTLPNLVAAEAGQDDDTGQRVVA